MSADEPKTVVWSVWLVASIVGAELLVCGVTGILASTPPVPSASLLFSNGTGSRVVVFAPSLAWGGVYLTLGVPSQPDVCAGHPSCSPPPGARTEGTVVSCLDPTCQRLGSYWANWTTNAPTGIALNPRQNPTPATSFLVKVTWTDTNTTVITLKEAWAGLTSLGLSVAWVAVAGGILIAAAWGGRILNGGLGARASAVRGRGIVCWRCRGLAAEGSASCPRCGASLG
jgi:hypothetical protein